MAGTFSADGKNAMLNAIGALAVYVGLLGADGSTEISGGTPAYARKAITWNGANAGAMTASNQPAFDVPASTVTKVIYCAELSGGTVYATNDVTDEVFAAQGTYTITSATLTISDPS